MTAQAASMHIVSRRALMGSSILVVESILRLGLVAAVSLLSLIHISETTRLLRSSRMPAAA